MHGTTRDKQVTIQIMANISVHRQHYQTTHMVRQMHAQYLLFHVTARNMAIFNLSDPSTFTWTYNIFWVIFRTVALRNNAWSLVFCDLWYKWYGGSHNHSLYHKLHIAIHMHPAWTSTVLMLKYFFACRFVFLMGASSTSDGSNLTRMLMILFPHNLFYSV